MEFSIAAADGSGLLAEWPAPLDYTKNLDRFVSSRAIASAQIHQQAIPDETDRVLSGASTVLQHQVAALQAVRDATKTLWEFADGTNVYKVRMKTFDLLPLGNNVYVLRFEFRVVSKRL